MVVLAIKPAEGTVVEIPAESDEVIGNLLPSQGDFVSGIVIVGELEPSQERRRQQDRCTYNRHDQSFANCPKSSQSSDGDKRDHGDGEREEGDQTDGAVGVDEERHNGYEQKGDTSVLQKIETPEEQPGNHHGRELGEITVSASRSTRSW